MGNDKPQDSAVDNSLLYFVSGEPNWDGGFKNGSLRPINDTFIALNQANNVTSSLEVDGGKVKTKGTFTNNTQIYLTDNKGAVFNFNTGKNSKDAAAAAISAFELGGPVNPFEKEAELFFPPQHLLQYSLASQGYAGWIDNLRASLSALSEEYKKEAAINLKPYKVNVSTGFINPKNEQVTCSTPYKNWYAKQQKILETQPENTVTVLAMARTRALLVSFSSEKYLDAQVTINTRYGAPAFLSSLPKNQQDLNLPPTKNKQYIDKTTAVVKEIKDKNTNSLGYGAVFYDALDTHGKAETVEDQIYQITVTFEVKKGKNPLGSELGSYTLMERIRFPIKNAFGEYDVINGDAISVEETLIKQFPLHYPHIIKRASDSRTLIGNVAPPAPLAGMGGFEFSLQNSLEKTKLVGGVLSGSTMMGLRKLGTAVWGSVDKGESILRDSVNLAFNVYDVADKLPGLMNTALDGVQVGNQNIGLLSDIPSTVDLPPSISAQLDNFIGQQAARHPLPDSLLKISRNAGKAIDALGPALDALTVFNDAAHLSGTWKNLEKAIGQYKAVLNDYAHKVLVVNADQTNFSVADEKKQRDKIDAFIKGNPDSRVVEPYGDGYIINARFNFDRSNFIADDSFQSLTELLKKLNHDEIWLTLEGHTCNLGRPEYNLKLSQRRAKALEKAIRDELGNSTIFIDAIGKGESEPLVGNTSEVNRARNRRVNAYFKFNQINQYQPSREGIAHIERLRTLSTLKQSDLPVAFQKTMKSVLDCIAGIPPTNPAHAAFSVLWMVGNVLVDAASFLDKALHGEGFIKSLENFDVQQVSAASNQLLLLKAPEGNESLSISQYLDGQMRIRAEAMNGLMALLMRCSIESSGKALERFEDQGKFFDDPRTGFYDRTFGKYSDGFSYQDNIKLYRVNDYIDRFILKDGWQLSINPIFPMSLDDHWIYLLRTSQIDEEALLPADEKWYEKAIDVVSDVKDMAVDFVVSADDYSDQFKDLTGNLINGCDYIYSNIKTLKNPDRKDLLSAKFQSLFPVHHLESDSLTEFVSAFIPDFTGLNDQSIAINTLNVRKRNSRKGVAWTSMWDWLKTNKKVSPFDQIQITVILNSATNDKVKELIKDKVITSVPVEAYPVRVDGLNMEGPSVTGLIKKLSLSDLTSEEKKRVEILEIEEADLYGAILHPSFMIGANVMYGTKPMANMFSAFLNVTDEHTLRSIFNWDHTWSMDYEYEVVLGSVADTKSTANYCNDIKKGPEDKVQNLTEFKLMLGASEDPAANFYKDEGILLDRHFLGIGKQKEDLPPFFKTAECFSLIQPNRSGAYHYSDSSWYSKSKAPFNINSNDQLELKSFNWQGKVKLAVVIVSDEIDIAAYKNRKISHRNIPGMVQLYRMGANVGEMDLPDNIPTGPEDIGLADVQANIMKTAPFSGPTYEVTFKEVGEIKLDDSNELSFTLAGDFDETSLDVSLESVFNSKQSLRVLSGLKEESQDASWIDKQLAKLKDNSKHVYVAQLELDYQNVIGELVDGLKPFKVFTESEDDIKDDWVWNLKLKVTTQGDSGFTNDNSKGAYSLPYPKGLFDVASKWYEPSKGNKDKALKEIEENIEIDKNNKVTTKASQRRPIHISPLIKWLSFSDSEGDSEVGSNEKRDAIRNWLNRQGGSRFLSYSKNRVMEDEGDIVKQDKKETA